MDDDLQRDKSFYEQKKKTRRTRKDEEGRNFTCPCGKSYLSYPALYTHTKTKHQGKPPKQDASVSMKVQPQPQNQKKQPLQQIKQILDKYFVNQNPGSYLICLSREDNEYLASINHCWQLVRESRIDDLSTSPSQNINNIFARFLSLMKPQVKGEAYVFLCEFICLFKNYLIEVSQNKQFCKITNGSTLPTYFSNLVIGKKQINPKKGSPLNNSLLLSKIVLNFGIWIFQQRYTNLLVKFNSL